VHLPDLEQLSGSELPFPFLGNLILVWDSAYQSHRRCNTVNDYCREFDKVYVNEIRLCWELIRCNRCRYIETYYTLFPLRVGQLQIICWYKPGMSNERICWWFRWERSEQFTGRMPVSPYQDQNCEGTNEVDKWEHFCVGTREIAELKHSALMIESRLFELD